MSAAACHRHSHPLHVAAMGETLELDRLSGGPDVVAHLASLGFVPGAELQIISTTANGPLIIAVKDGRMIISRGMARNIWVR